MTKKASLIALLAPVVMIAAGWRGAKPEISLAAVGAPAPAATTRLVVATTGNEARYRVRERLASMELPYDAVGKTRDISGAIVIDASGRLVPSQSRVVVKVTGLSSDQERRDGMVQRRLLETAKYPEVVLEPTALRGLTGPLPTTGTRSFEMVGNLTLRGVTRPTVWTVTAHFNGERVTGSAVTSFTFQDFQLQKPSVPVVLSLADQLKLEYDFTLVRQAGS
jgi:polyisoprenoid-binding protein YceI